MENKIEIFKNEEFGEVRVIEINDELHFVAKDVAERLGYKWQPNIVGHVPDEWKGVNPINTPGGTQEVITLSEQGLYFFLARSDKPSALPFQKWIAGDVVPSIRKRGVYVPKPLSTIEMLELMLKGMKEQQREIEDNKQEIAGVKEQVRQLEAKTTLDIPYYAVMGYATLVGKHVDRQEANKLGRLASGICRNRGICIGSTYHPCYGKVNTYPVEVLEETFAI